MTLGFVEVDGKDFDYRDSGAWHFNIESIEHFSCTVSSLICQVLREKQTILAEPVIMPNLPQTIEGAGVIYIMVDKHIDHAKVLEEYMSNLNATFSESVKIKVSSFDDQNFPLKNRAQKSFMLTLCFSIVLKYRANIRPLLLE